MQMQLELWNFLRELHISTSMHFKEANCSVMKQAESTGRWQTSSPQEKTDGFNPSSFVTIIIRKWLNCPPMHSAKELLGSMELASASLWNLFSTPAHKFFWSAVAVTLLISCSPCSACLDADLGNSASWSSSVETAIGTPDADLLLMNCCMFSSAAKTSVLGPAEWMVTSGNWWICGRFLIILCDDPPFPGSSDDDVDDVFVAAGSTTSFGGAADENSCLKTLDADLRRESLKEWPVFVHEDPTPLPSCCEWSSSWWADLERAFIRAASWVAAAGARELAATGPIEVGVMLAMLTDSELKSTTTSSILCEPDNCNAAWGSETVLPSFILLFPCGPAAWYWSLIILAALSPLMMGGALGAISLAPGRCDLKWAILYYCADPEPAALAKMERISKLRAWH